MTSLDGLTVVGADGKTMASVAFTDGPAIVALFNELLGSSPAGTRDAPDAKYQFAQTYYDWGGVRAVVPDEAQSRTHVAFTTSEVNGVQLTAIGGIRLGMSRADAVARGAQESSFDGDGDGKGDFLQLDARAVSGTNSLTTPGAVGSDFILILLDGDAVVSIQSGGNDYGDL
ncbi:hypothetical protein [Microbacterium rhizomatis]|uniref:Uncharacterized protein n=1 Tax=Microbacterium rhizomatis TaxID=1631477 RepID=A0A5J5J2B4_9MICO|nr:hypothetical protein [Microbacterium rhizomatis]KAA9110211.1 hypothetical protein F6B43_00435 [Microbacterium rhizomatis]